MRTLYKSFILNFIIIFSNLSCSFLNQSEDYIYFQWASVDKIEVMSNQRGYLELKIDLSVPTPCNEFHTKEMTKNRDTIFVRYYSKVKKGIPCILIIGHITYYDSFQLQAGKSYLFKFFQSDEKTLDTLIFIN